MGLERFYKSSGVAEGALFAILGWIGVCAIRLQNR
jgi:hypothetical protein